MKREQQAVEALKVIISLLDTYKFKWVITGGFASHVYGVKRPITDIDFDIDTSKDSPDFQAFMKDLQKFITQPLEHFVDQNYDNYTFEVTLHDIVVDICPMAEMNVYDKTASKYVHFYESGFPAFEEVLWNGLKLNVLSKDLIIKNKEMLVWQRESDMKDVRGLRGG